MSDQTRVFYTRLDGSEPLHEVLPDFTDEEIAQIRDMVSTLPISDHPNTEVFIEKLQFIIQQHRDMIETERDRIALQKTQEAAKKIQKYANNLTTELQLLTRQQQQAFNAPLQIDLYVQGEMIPEKTQWNPNGDFPGVDVLRDVSPYFEHHIKELERMARLCEYVKGYELSAGRTKKIGPEEFAQKVTNEYFGCFNVTPSTTRDGPYEQLVSFTGTLAGHVIESWHRYLLK